MSFEKDVAEIKTLIEQDVFKSATPEQLTKRKEDLEARQSKELYSKAENASPGIVDKLRKEFGNEVLVQTAIAYAECYIGTQAVGRQFGIDIGYKIRDLDWPGTWIDGDTFLKAAEIVNGYNAFDTGVARSIVQMFGDRQYKLARESSVAVYIKPVKEEEMGWLRGSEGWNTFGADEEDLEGDMLRLWWD